MGISWISINQYQWVNFAMGIQSTNINSVNFHKILQTHPVSQCGARQRHQINILPHGVALVGILEGRGQPRATAEPSQKYEVFLVCTVIIRGNEPELVY